MQNKRYSEIVFENSFIGKREKCFENDTKQSDFGLNLQAGVTEHAKALGPKGSDPHKAAVIGDTIGDPLKDTSGPSLNILIKLMAVESLVFAPFFATHGGLIFKLL